MNDNNKFSKSSVFFPLKEMAMAFGDTGLPINHIMIGITNPEPKYKIYRRNSGCYVFEYVVDGEGEIVINGEKHRVKKGDTYMLFQGEEHLYYSNANNPMKKYWINFKCEYLKPMLDGYGLEQGVYKTDTKAIFENLIYLSNSDKPFFEIYSELAENIHSIVVRAALTSKTKTNSDSFCIREKLLSSIYKKPSLKEIASELNMSESNLIRVFKKSYGITPYEFLLKSKIDVAKLLLTDTDISVKEIAERIKITDEHYFSTLFFQRVGVRPTEFRKQYRTE